jgi:hypothetical protein
MICGVCLLSPIALMFNADSHGPSSLLPIRDCRIWTGCCAPHMPPGKRYTPGSLLLYAVGLNDSSTISACTLATVWIYHIDEEQIAAKRSVTFTAKQSLVGGSHFPEQYELHTQDLPFYSGWMLV